MTGHAPQLSLPPLSFQGSRDNMSVVLVCLPNAPKVSEEAVKRDAELDKYLESRVEGGCWCLVALLCFVCLAHLLLLCPLCVIALSSSLSPLPVATNAY